VVEEGRLNGYEPEAWFEFGVGIIGAAAALAGLLFVAMSINIERILALPKLPYRAGGKRRAIRPTAAARHLAACARAGHDRLGLEVLATGLVCGGLLLWLIRPSNRSGEGTTFWLLGSLLPSLALTALTVVGGTTLVIGQGGGLYWLAPAVVIAFATGLAGAWVLLVEILR
jgi:hypothetical protein